MKSDSLYRLIHSMDKHEIAYCSEALMRDSGAMAEDRMFLFYALWNMEKYDGGTIKEALAGRKIATNLAVEKNRLFQRVSFHLSVYLEDKKSANDPEKILRQAEALVHLAMLEEALEVTQRGIVWAVRLEELHLEVKLRDVLRLIYKNMGQNGLDTLRIENEYLMETAAKKLARSVRYRLINDRAFDYLRRYRVADLESVGKGMEELINLPEMKDVKMADSLQSQLHYYLILSFYHSSRNEMSEAIDAQMWHLKLLESNQERLKLYQSDYLSIISNILGKLSILKRFDEAPELLRKMEFMVVRGKRKETRKFANVELQYQLYYMNSGQLERVFEREQKVQHGLRKFGTSVTGSAKLALLYNFGIAHLICNETRKALNYFNQIKGLGVLPYRKDLQGVSRLIRLLLLVENDQGGTFKHYLRNSKRFFRSGDKAYKLEAVIITWLEDHHKIKASGQKKKSFQKLARSVQQFVKASVIGSEEIQIWAVAHAKQVTVNEVFEKGIHKTV